MNGRTLGCLWTILRSEFISTILVTKRAIDGLSTLQIFHSEGYKPLRAVTKAISNDNSGGGQYQIGMLKKPTETVSVVFDGFQERGIDEGQMYGGIFVEDSADDCISR